MIFEEGFVHADMHPGNVFLRAGGELVVLDAGLVAVLSAKDQRDFVDFFFGLANDEGDECARIVWDTALGRPDDDPTAWPRFRQAMVELVSRYAHLASKDFEIARFVYDLIELQRRFHIRGSTAFIMTVLSMVVYDGICKALYPECDFQKEARGYLIHARYRLTGNEVGGRVNPNFG
ncbi:MAG: AarF/UbiB family protein, partial [Pseudomonadota bacterium]